MFESKKNIRLMFAAILIITAFAVFLDFPQIYDKSSEWIYQSFSIKFPKFPNIPFRLGLDLQGGTHLIYEADVSNIPQQDRTNSLEGIRDVIERRVDAFGVSEPNVQTSRSQDSHRLLVELAGVKDVNLAIAMIGETPLLEFKKESVPTTTDNLLSAEEQKELDDYNQGAKELSLSVLEQVKSPDANFAELVWQYSEDEGSKEYDGMIGYAKRGMLVPEFEEVCFDKLQINDTYDEIVETQFGFHIIKKLDHLYEEEQEANCAHILIKKKNIYDIRPDLAYPEWEYTGLTGKQLKKAQVTFDGQIGAPQVSLEFDSEGSKLFAELTRNNVGKFIAIFLDGQPISIPVVNEPITSGQAVITGNFSLKEAKLLAQRLNAGALPVPINLISQETIGASLGRNALRKSLTAAFIGIILVSIFMVLIYRLIGLTANFSLLIYGLILLALFKLIPVTLTLAGIAGFILSLGMAVDANVLVFERIKEELKRGNVLNNAIKNGFKRAWPSIRDGNISTLITSIILMWFSTSIVKGFAITLSIGIVVSMFSALIVNRIFILITPAKIFENRLWLFGLSKKSIINQEKSQNK